MATFTVYQFTETMETCVLPTSWVIDGQVKYDSRKASDYAKKGKLPYKKWPTYKVEPICAQLFGSYNAAYRAESVLLQKSDLESTDIEAINNPTQIMNKKRRQNKLVLPKTNSAIETDESNLSSIEDDEVSITELPPLNAIVTNNETVLTHDTTNYGNNNETDMNKDDNEIFSEVPIIETKSIDVITDIINDVPLSALSTESQVNELKELIIAQNNLIQQQNMKIDNLTALVTNMSKQLKKLKQVDYTNNTDGNIMTVTRWAFPMQALDDVKELETSLKNAENGSVKEFKSFLLQLGGTTLKTTIKFIIQEIYSLELQQKLNYSGRENKFSTKNLIQTKLILEVMQLNTNRTLVEAINEYMYHMQHVTDRIRAMTKKAK